MKSFIKRGALFSLLIGTALSVAAQSAHIQGTVVDEEGLPLPGADVYWMGGKSGTITDEKGNFDLEPEGNLRKIIVSFIGYQNDTLSVTPDTHVKVKLSSLELDEVNVSAKKMLYVLNSRVDVVQTQKMNEGELRRAACCNLGESFVNNPSVDVSYSDAATGAKQIKLLGLSGSYVQMLTEKIPNFRGLASPFGLNFIPGPWMESIQVSKGIASVADGFEALTGQINVEYKKPISSDQLSINLFGSSARRLEGNIDAAFKINDTLSTMLFAHYENDTKEHDMGGDGFLDQPKVQQVNLFNRWYYRTDKLISQVGAKYIYEDRKSGETKQHREKTENPYEIGITTHRGELFTKNGIMYDDKGNSSLGIIVAGSYHDQKASYGRAKYDANQGNLYANIIYETELHPAHAVKGGASFNGDWFHESIDKTEADANEFIPGIFAEYTFKWQQKFVAMVGVRGDYHRTEKFFVTPRLHLKYDPCEWVYFRGSIEKGSRTTRVLGENSYLMASSRKILIDEQLKRESAWNFGISANAFIPTGKKRKISVITEWYYTHFTDQVIADLDSDPHQVHFTNLDGRSYSSTFQAEVNYEFFRGFTVTAAHRITDVKQTINGRLREKPLTSRFKTLLTVMYQTPLKKWQFDVTGQLNGGGRMPDPDPDQPLWERRYKPFPLLSGQVTRRFKHWSVYAGAENILNFTQEHPIIDAENPWGEHFDASMVWGPVHGRKFYAGLRWSLPQKD